MNDQIPKVDDLKKLRKPVRNSNSEYHERVSGPEWLALFVTERVGTMGFFFLTAGWTLVWFAWNTVGPIAWRFDPYPAFVLWLFISNFIQLVFLPLIMVGQNLQGRHAEVRAENDFQINLKSEREIEAVLMHLENQEEMIREIVRRLDEKNNGRSKHHEEL